VSVTIGSTFCPWMAASCEYEEPPYTPTHPQQTTSGQNMVPLIDWTWLWEQVTQRAGALAKQHKLHTVMPCSV
jgi:hypothetical protein